MNVTSPDHHPGTPESHEPPRCVADDRGIDVSVAVDLVMVHRGLTASDAHELLRGHADATGRDLRQVASDIIDLGTARLPR